MKRRKVKIDYNLRERDWKLKNITIENILVLGILFFDVIGSSIVTLIELNFGFSCEHN